MSVLDIFQTRPAVTVQQAQPAAGDQSLGTTPGSGTGATPAPILPTPLPGANDPGAFKAGKQGGESPLENFKDLWIIDDKQRPQNAQEALTPNFKIDAVAISEAAKGIDYSKLVPPEMMSKALGGDVASFAQILNAVTQAATANAGINSARIVEAALGHQAKSFAEVLPAEVRRHNVASQITQDHPIFSNPAAAPMVGMLKDQFAAKYPMATPAQISDYTASYLTDFVKSLGGTMPDANAEAAKRVADSKTTDWDNYLGG